MIRAFTRSIPLGLLLALCTAVPVMTAAVAVVQIPPRALTEENLRPASAPVTFFLHSLAGVVVGMWLLNMAVAEWLVRRLAWPSRRPGTTPPSLATRAAALFLPWVLCGCAATMSVEFAGQRPVAPVCQGANAPLSAVVFWGPNWRPDQKDVGAREQAAERGIADFFATQDCFARTQVQRLASGTLGSLDEAKAALAASGIGAQRVVYVVVRELGPVVKLLSSVALIQGGTEVVLDVAIYDPARGQQARFTTHWRHGGAGVVKGVASLPGDMRAALATALSVARERPDQASAPQP